MFVVGDTIIYVGYSVCKIIDIRNMTVGFDTCPFYVLKPVFEEKSTVYVPVGDEKIEARMQRILSADEIYAVIRDMPDVKTIWIEDEKERKEKFKQILSGTDRSDLVTLIITLYVHQQELKNITKSKKLRASDEQFLRAAETALFDEFSHVLNIERTDVLPFVLEQIENANKQDEDGIV